jgi:hypothetical protein
MRSGRGRDPRFTGRAGGVPEIATKSPRLGVMGLEPAEVEAATTV